MYLLLFPFLATIFITLHSGSEQVLAMLHFQPVQLCSLIMIMYRWLDLLIASWYIFLPNFDEGYFQASSTLQLCYSVQTMLWPAEDWTVFVAYTDMSFCSMLPLAVHTAHLKGEPYEARLEPGLGVNVFPDAILHGDKEKELTWKGLISPDGNIDSFCGLKTVYCYNEIRVYSFAMLTLCLVRPWLRWLCWMRPVKTSN